MCHRVAREGTLSPIVLLICFAKLEAFLQNKDWYFTIVNALLFPWVSYFVVVAKISKQSVCAEGREVPDSQ